MTAPVVIALAFLVVAVGIVLYGVLRLSRYEPPTGRDRAYDLDKAGTRPEEERRG